MLMEEIFHQLWAVPDPNPSVQRSQHLLTIDQIVEVPEGFLSDLDRLPL